MSRFKILAANPRRSLAALATVLLAVGITGASGANFNAQTANAGNTFASGALDMSNDDAPAGGAILSMSNMKPGDSTSGRGRHQEHRHRRRHVHAQQGHADQHRRVQPDVRRRSTSWSRTAASTASATTSTTSSPPSTAARSTAMGTGISLGTPGPAAPSTATSSRRRSTLRWRCYENDGTTAQFVWNATS